MTDGKLYDRFRLIGLSVESADTMADACADMSDRKVDIIELYLLGQTMGYIGDIIGVSRQYVHKVIKSLRMKVDK